MKRLLTSKEASEQFSSTVMLLMASTASGLFRCQKPLQSIPLLIRLKRTSILLNYPKEQNGGNKMYTRKLTEWTRGDPIFAQT